MKFELAPDMYRRLSRTLRQAGSKEIEGMLFAQELSPNHFRLTDFSTDSFANSYGSVARDIGVHPEQVIAFSERTGTNFSPYTYIGRWHSSSSWPLAPSPADLQPMQSIVESGTSPISFALLLIVRQRFKFWLDYSLTTFSKGSAPRGATISERWI